MTEIVPVILSGGSGTRLWPLSTAERPKQFLPLTARDTMLQLTARRAHGGQFSAPIVVANVAHAAEVERQLTDSGTPPQLVILEPTARNTAPAIALAALAARRAAPLLVMPSDHVIADCEAFHAAIHAALPLVDEGWLVTFGITPDAPETGYGYIKVGDEVVAGVHRVDHFAEKPARAAAEAMLAAGNYAWNSGIFLFRADQYLLALAEHAPAMAEAAERAMVSARREGARLYPDAGAFAAAPSISIDYAVMEKVQRAAVVPIAMGWSDVGSWDALHAVSESDRHGNVVSGDVVVLDSSNCLVRGDGVRVATVGIRDLIVVASGKDVLVLPRSRSQDVKLLLEAMKK